MTKPLLSLLFTVAAALLATASACPPAEGEGEGEGREGEGEGEGGEGEGEGGAGEGEGEGSAGEGEGEGSAGPNSCTTDDDCTATEHCDTIFSGGGGSSCYAACDTQGGSCTTKAGNAGQCQRFGDASRPLICFSLAADLEPCGNAANAGCLNENDPGDPNDDALCVTLGDVAATPQDEGDFSFCATPCNAGTPCATGACSDDLQFTMGGSADTYGICGPVSTTTTVCGASAASLGVCTGAFSCAVPTGQNTGTCAADAGEGEGEGE